MQLPARQRTMSRVSEPLAEPWMERWCQRSCVGGTCDHLANTPALIIGVHDRTWGWLTYLYRVNKQSLASKTLSFLLGSRCRIELWNSPQDIWSDYESRPRLFQYHDRAESGHLDREDRLGTKRSRVARGESVDRIILASKDSTSSYLCLEGFAASSFNMVYTSSFGCKASGRCTTTPVLRPASALRP